MVCTSQDRLYSWHSRKSKIEPEFLEGTVNRNHTRIYFYFCRIWSIAQKFFSLYLNLVEIVFQIRDTGMRERNAFFDPKSKDTRRVTARQLNSAGMNRKLKTFQASTGKHAYKSFLSHIWSDLWFFLPNFIGFDSRYIWSVLCRPQDMMPCFIVR